MRILFISKWHVLPADTGGKIRTCQVLKGLARRHEVHLVYNTVGRPNARGRWEGRALSGHGCSFGRDAGGPGDVPSDSGFLDGVRCHAVPTTTPAQRDWRYWLALGRNFVHPAPFNAHKDRDPALIRAVSELCHRLQPDVVICDFVQTALNCNGIHHWPSVLFQHNVEAEVFWRQARRAPKGTWRALFALQAQKMLRFERDMVRRFDVVVAISERDKVLFEQLYGCRNVFVIDTAVDVERYADVRPDRRSRRVLFIGGLDWIPNPHGVTHFCRRIWPLIRAEVPDATFEIVGRNPGPDLAEVVSGIPGVTLVGTVPDTRPYLARAAVCVVPLYMGGGTRMKIYEYMAPGLPVVSTSLGCEGLPVRHGEHLLVADSDEAFARAVVRLLSDPEYAQRIGQQAASFVRQNFAADVAAVQFEGHLRQAIRLFRARRTAENNRSVKGASARA